MMAGDSATPRPGNTRPVLGDVTNRPGKRASSSIVGSLGLKSQNGPGKISNAEEGHSQFGKRTCLGLEKIRTNFTGTGKGKDVSLLKGRQGSSRLPPSCGINIFQDNVTTVVAKAPNQIVQASDTVDSGIHPARADAIIHSFTEVGDASRDSCLSTSEMPIDSGLSHRGFCVVTGKYRDDPTGCPSDGAHSHTVCKPSITRVCKDGRKDLGVNCLASNNDGSVECSRLAEQLGSKSFEITTHTELKNNNCTNLNAGTDAINNCSCSFCTKAAYMWSDLHYQDIKGRIASLRKSQKEAAILVQRNCRGKDTNSHGHANVNKSSNIESDLMNQWKSLFLHMEDILVRENSQLQANFLALQDLRDHCKMQLELIDGDPPDRQKRDSDAPRD